MTLLNLSSFLNKLRIKSYDIYQLENTQSTQTQSGQVLTVAYGPRLWTGNIICSADTIDGQRALQTLATRIQNTGTYFYMNDISAQYPLNYKTGDGLSSASPVIGAGISAGYSMPISGLPANYTLATGDYVSYAIGGVYFMYQISSDVTTSAGGVATLSLTTPIYAQSVPNVGTAIQLINPRVTAVYVPNSFKPVSYELGFGEGFSFEWIQTTKT